MITVKDVWHSFDTNVVLEDVNFVAKDANVLGLVGINGSGKSTLLRVLSGVYQIQHGEVLYEDRSPADADVRKDIFLLPDDPYFTNQSTCRNLLDLYKMLYPQFDANTYKEIISYFRLDPNKPIRSFSKGMRRQTFIALAFAVGPKYMLLDEAFDGLDPLARNAFKQRITEMVKEKGSTVIVSSHALKELADFCNEYLLIDRKHVIYSENIIKENAKVFKYQLIFKDGVDSSKFEGIKARSVQIVGIVATVIMEGNEEEVKAKLQALSPDIMERIDVNFEEAFIGERGRFQGGGVVR
ncbi:MAG: ABC transporter ATP-binding protein [Clostridiales bacterium]|nr:ABC transporter ATP-binding protein [Clostridiales bacterium]